jgi:hypothetical protein
VDFLGSHHISNCDEAWAGCCFSMEPVVFKVTVSSGIFFDLPPQLGLEPATHISEALAERYLNGSQRILGN